MVLSVMMLGGILLGVSTFAGLLMVYQVRQANDALNSVKAIFAADAGIEWRIYTIYKATSTLIEPPVFSNGASVTSSVDYVRTDTGIDVVIRSKGFSGKVVRALETVLGQ